MDDTTPPQEPVIASAKNLTQTQLAAEPDTDPDLLRSLASSSDQKIREAVAVNPNTPPDVLLKLGAEFPSQLLDNSVFPLLLLENPNLVAEIPLPTLQSILKQDNVPVFILEQAADKADLEVQLALVNNIQTSKSVLSRLKQSQHPQIIESARLHINFAGELTAGSEERVGEVIQEAMPSAGNVDTRSLAVLSQICLVPEFIVELWVRESSYESLCRKIVNSPATSPGILKHLANHTDGYTREEVTRNTNTPPETLRKLASEEKYRIYVASNPSTPGDVLGSLSKDKSKSVRLYVTRNPNTPLTVLKDLANDTDIEIAETAARIVAEQQGEYTASAASKNPKTPPEVLEKLAQEAPWAVFPHPNAPPELLVRFSKSANLEIRRYIAENPNTPASILEDLAYDESSNVRWKVAQNRNAPISLLFKQLARDTSVNTTIAYQMSTSKYYFPEAEDILDILAEESTSPLEVILQRLARDGSEATRLFLARRFDLPADLLAQLAGGTEVKVRSSVAQNPNTPISALEKLAKDEDSTVRMHTASNTNLSPELLEKLASDKLEEVRKKAMVNPSLPKEVVERILCGEFATNYLKLNPDFLSRHLDSKSLVINYYAKSRSPWVRFIALTQPQISQELLQEKSVSISWLERLAVALNPHSARDILKLLAEDSNQLVRAAAKAILQHHS